MNNCYQRAPWADAIYGCDREWWNAYAERVRRVCSGEYWTVNPTAAPVHGLNVLSYQRGGGLTNKPNTVKAGGNSGFQAVGVALLFGAARVILLGYDMQATNKRLHWHPNHDGKLHNPTKRYLEIWRTAFEELAKESPVPIINATRETALQCFPRMTIDEALA